MVLESARLGEGGVRQRPDGRKRKSVYGKTKQEALQKPRKAQRELEQGKAPTPERLTVAQHLDYWLEHAIKPTRTSKTYASYAQMIRLHIAPAVGRHLLSKLTPRHVDAMLAVMREKGLSPPTIQYARDILRSALGRAMKWDLLGGMLRPWWMRRADGGTRSSPWISSRPVRCWTRSKTTIWKRSTRSRWHLACARESPWGCAGATST